MKKFRDGMLGPTVILGTICLVITFALAGTYEATKEPIRLAGLRAAETARALVLPAARTEEAPQGAEEEAEESFVLIEGIALPEGVKEAYKAVNGSGYVFVAGAKGFGGVVTFYVGMDADGNYVGINMFDHDETPGLGTKVGADSYLEKYYGRNTPSGVDAITGATRTSNALKNTLLACNEAYELVKEA